MHIINDQTGTLEYISGFFNETDQFFNSLSDELIWSKPNIKIFGKSIPIPREQAFYGDNGLSYKYSGTVFPTLNWHPTLITIRKQLEEFNSDSFNCVLCNLYTQGQDYMSLHSDNERELGSEPVIASVSFGETRIFQIQRKDKSEKIDIELNDGDVLFMRGKFQEFWNHGIKKTAKEKAARINLTFRYIYK
jgi:alkylated DNA repair dioxygenase AlkB